MIDLGAFVRFTDPDDRANPPPSLFGFVSHLDPAWKFVPLFTPLLITRRKAGKGPLAFVGIGEETRAAFEPEKAVWDVEAGVWVVRWSDVLAFTHHGRLELQEP